MADRGRHIAAALQRKTLCNANIAKQGRCGYHLRMAANDSFDEKTSLLTHLLELRIEHRDLDDAITQLEAAPPEDELALRRMKKRKLLLKDRIAVLERQLDPDEYA